MSEQDKPMIYREVRTLPDGCHACRRSDTYCHAVRDMERRPCCDNCQHDN